MNALSKITWKIEIEILIIIIIIIKILKNNQSFHLLLLLTESPEKKSKFLGQPSSVSNTGRRRICFINTYLKELFLVF